MNAANTVTLSTKATYPFPCPEGSFHHGPWSDCQSCNRIDSQRKALVNAMNLASLLNRCGDETGLAGEPCSQAWRTATAILVVLGFTEKQTRDFLEGSVIDPDTAMEVLVGEQFFKAEREATEKAERETWAMNELIEDLLWQGPGEYLGVEALWLCTRSVVLRRAMGIPAWHGSGSRVGRVLTSDMAAKAIDAALSYVETNGGEVSWTVEVLGAGNNISKRYVEG